jgi:hypothetical protein
MKLTRFLPGRKPSKNKNEVDRRHQFLHSYVQGDIYRSSCDDDDDGGGGKDVEERTNIYEACLVGINWFNFLKKISPKIPTKVTPELKREIFCVDTTELKNRFGSTPARCDLPEIERYLGIELYLLYGGRFSPLGVSYHSRKDSESTASNITRELEERATRAQSDQSAMVILQSARPFFHKLGVFHVIPTRKVCEERDKGWIHLWSAIVKFRWPKLKGEAHQEKIEKIKEELVDRGSSTMFSITDGVFQRLRSRYQVSVRLFIGKFVNDNVNEKTCFFATRDVKNREPLNLIVASYAPDQFDKEFKKIAKVSYNQLRREPWHHPILAANAKYQRQQDADRNARAVGLYDITEENLEEEEDEEEEDDDVNYEEEENNPYLDLIWHDDDDDDNDAEGSDYEQRAQELIELSDQVYRPIRNTGSVAPNVFNDNTLVRILQKNEVIKMPACPTKNCLYSSSKPKLMERHVKSCRDETKCVIRQSVADGSVNDYVAELFDEGWLPCPEYSHDFFVTYDIECLMSVDMLHNDSGGGGDERSYHNLATIAVMTSDGQRFAFKRLDMKKHSVIEVLARFINCLALLRREMCSRLPDSISKGIEHYKTFISDNAKKLSFDVLKPMRKKLHYLTDFQKLKIYSWCGESYDMCVMFPSLVSVLYEFVGRRSNKINIIKRDGSYMLVEAIGLSFRDFRNYTAPMSLAALAKSCGLDSDEYSKGSFPYEWYTTVEQLESAQHFPAYPCFYSTLSSGACQKGEQYVDEMNAIIKENIESGDWSSMEIIPQLAEFLNLDSLLEDPVVHEHCQKKATRPMSVFQNHVNTLTSIVDTINCQIDRRDYRALRFFRFSPKTYRESRQLWRQQEQQFGEEDMNMMTFLINYNFNDVKLLTGAINAYATNYLTKFKLPLHSDLSIAKMAQKIAFIQYDATMPPIYSIPPTAAFFYNDCRAKLLGGICQVFHRAIYLNEKADSRIPKAATTAPNGERYKSLVSLDFNSLYPWAVSGDLPLGPGIIYTIGSNLPKRTSRFAKNISAGSDYDETKKFYFNEGLFNQKQNTSLESIRWLEHLNWSQYNGKLEHSYNLRERKIGNHHVDGYVELPEEEEVAPGIPKKIIFEFRGCSYHTCPYCIRKPWLGCKKKVRNPDTGEYMTQIISAAQLAAEDAARIHEIVDTLRDEYGGDLAMDSVFGEDEDGNETSLPMFGPLNFKHEIVIEYNCRWKKKWYILEHLKTPPYSPTYPFLYKGARPETSSRKPLAIGVTIDDFKRKLRERRDDGSSAFFGLAMVNLTSPPEVVQANPYIPPIFDKKHLTSDMLTGHMERLLPAKVVERLYPSDENIFCYNTKRYLATSEMLAYYDRKGIEFDVEYFVEYYRGAPFAPFVKTMVKDRVIALRQGNITMQLVVKLLLNAMVGRFALAVSRFVICRVVGCDKMLDILRSPMVKSTKSLRCEDDELDPLHEVVKKKKSCIEDLALQIQIFVYQERVCPRKPEFAPPVLARSAKTRKNSARSAEFFKLLPTVVASASGPKSGASHHFSGKRVTGGERSHAKRGGLRVKRSERFSA